MNLKTIIKTTTFCALLLNLFVLSAPQLISGCIVSATVDQAVFWPNNYQEDVDTEGEFESSPNQEENKQIEMLFPKKGSKKIKTLSLFDGGFIRD